MTILITGASGQLEQTFCNILTTQNIIHKSLDKTSFDITNIDLMLSSLRQLKPNVIINTAAYTKVDLAESFSEEAFRINDFGSECLAKACNELNIPLVHFSTDYVFDGMKELPYVPKDHTNPLNVYGKSKLAGEHSIQNNCDNYLIIRSSWLYSQHGTNFLKTMLRLGNRDQALEIISDQIGSPTSAVDLAKSVISILPIIQSTDFSSGIYHCAGNQTLSWSKFAEEIFYFMHANGLIKNIPMILPILSSDYPSEAKRPMFSALDSSIFLTEFNIDPLENSKAIEQACMILKNSND
jgi:dTDP-4-dehydrorhamnose reductase